MNNYAQIITANPQGNLLPPVSKPRCSDAREWMRPLCRDLRQPRRRPMQILHWCRECAGIVLNQPYTYEKPGSEADT